MISGSNLLSHAMHVARVSREHVYHDACLKIHQVHVIVSHPHPHHQILSSRCTRSGPLCQECPADTSPCQSPPAFFSCPRWWGHTRQQNEVFDTRCVSEHCLDHIQGKIQLFLEVEVSETKYKT